MKRYIFPLLMFVLLLGVNKTHAQQANKGKVANNQPAKQQAAHYDMALSPAKDKVIVAVSSNDETTFDADVIKPGVKEPIHLTSTKKGSKSNNSFDISNLPSGDYILVIKGTSTNSIRQIAFKK